MNGHKDILIELPETPDWIIFWTSPWHPSYGSQKDKYLEFRGKEGYIQHNDWLHNYLTGILKDFKVFHSSSSKQQAWPILCGWKSSIACISFGLGTYEHLKK